MPERRAIMAQRNLSRSLQLMFGDEGGYVNNPKDPGGPTKYGVTINTLKAWRKNNRLTADDVKKLELGEATLIARSEYWNAIRGDDLPPGLDYAVFDCAYNSGPAQAAKLLQRILNVSPDGVIGAKTLDAMRKYLTRLSLERLITAYCDERMKFLRSLKNWPSFSRGWTRRVTGVDPEGKMKKTPGVIGNALSMAKGYVVQTPITVEQVPLANPNETKVTATSEGKAASIAGIGALGTACTDAASQLAPFTDALPVIRWAFIGLTMIGIGFGLYTSIQKIRTGNA